MDPLQARNIAATLAAGVMANKSFALENDTRQVAAMAVEVFRSIFDNLTRSNTTLGERGADRNPIVRAKLRL